MSNSNIDIYNFSKKFAVKIVKLCNWLDQKPGARRTLSNQLIRSGTSIGANLYEGKYAESTADFIHKLKLSRKECSETIAFGDSPFAECKCRNAPAFFGLMY